MFEGKLKLLMGMTACWQIGCYSNVTPLAVIFRYFVSNKVKVSVLEKQVITSEE